MALDDRSGLIDTVVSYAFRAGDADFVAMVPTFIQLTESRINRTLRIAAMEQSASIILTDGAGPLPDDYLSARRIYAGSPSVELQLVAPDWAGTEYPTNYGGVARHVTIVGNTIQTYPSSTGPVSLAYYAKIPPLTDAEPVNWLLTKAPELYLYGCLIEAAPYMMDDTRLQGWMTLFLGAMKDLRSEDGLGRYALGSARISGPTP